MSVPSCSPIPGASRDFFIEQPQMRTGPPDELPVIVSPMAAALAWCVENNAGLIINPGGDDICRRHAKRRGRVCGGMDPAWRSPSGGVLDSEHDERGRGFLAGEWALANIQFQLHEKLLHWRR